MSKKNTAARRTKDPLFEIVALIGRVVTQAQLTQFQIATINRRLEAMEKTAPPRRQGKVKTFSPASVDRLIWLVTEIEKVCPRPGVRGAIKVSHSDARLVRPIVEAIVHPSAR